MIHFVRENMAPLMFGGMVLFMLIGYPAAFSLAAAGLFFGIHRHRAWTDQSRLPRQSHLPAVRHHLERPSARDPVLHLYGRDPRALRSRGGFARFDRTIVRPGARRVVLCGDLRRRDSRRDHRDGCRLGHRHGRHLDDAHAEIRLFDATYDGRHRSVRHHHPAHSAVARPDRAGRPARSLGRRHVCRRHRSEHDSARAVLHLGADRQLRLAEGRAGAAARGSHPAGLGALEKMPYAASSRRSD